MISEPFIKARIAYYKSRINSLPRGEVGINNNREISVVRTNYFVNGKRRRHEYYVTTPQGRALMAKITERKKYEALLKKYQARIGKVNIATPTTIENKNRTYKNRLSCLSGSYFETLRQNVIPESAKDKKKYPYEYNGIRMRSRAEIELATLLDADDFEFVYETVLVLEDRVVYPDFAIYVPELDCCILIEFFGMMDDAGYVKDNMGKIQDYIDFGIKPGLDILFVYGTAKEMPDPILIRLSLHGILNYLAMSVFNLKD